MNKARAERIAQLMQRELGNMILTEVKDPRIGFVSITHVDLSRDLSMAKVFVSVMGNAEEVEQALSGLRSASAFLRGEISRRLSLRYAPKLEFRADSSIVESLHIHEIIKTLSESSND